MQRFLVLAALATLVPHAQAEPTWPVFRGGAVAGVVEDKNLPDTWDKTKNVAWVTEIPGSGWSSPIVWGDKIFLTSVIQDAKAETPKKGLYFGGERKAPPAGIHHWMVYCVDWQTGKIVWQKQAHEGPAQATHHIKNTFASETPVTDGERVYVYFGNLGLFCYDMSGKELWSKPQEVYPTMYAWGTASSPIVYKERVYVVNDNEKHSYIEALDARTGKEIWKVDRDEKTTWATPFIWENDKRTELVVCGIKKIRSYDLEGKLLWELGPMSQLVIPTPLTGHGLLYVTSGYVLDKIRPLYAVKPGASGDISLKPDENSNSYVAWHHKLAGSYNPSPILYGDYLYVLYDRGLLGCFDARTGKEIYKERIAPGANAFTVSPWAYDGKIFCLSEDGDTFVIQAGPQYKLLGKNSLDEMCMATPAITDGSLIIRTQTKLYRIKKQG
jgi:outer membrane protein assembly factor BamB